MEKERINQLFANAINFVDRKENEENKKSLKETLEQKMYSLIKINELISKDDVLSSIRKIVPEFKYMIEVTEDYYNFLKKSILTSYVRRTDTLNQRLSEQSIDFQKWDDIDTELNKKKEELLSLIESLYENKEMTEMTKDSIDDTFESIFKIKFSVEDIVL